tara:strand:- start:467 stop:895 length:429 start_codon:yes stop_codon:yes gene_type:complete
MCRVLEVARAGFYFWIDKPLSDRALEDRRLLPLIKDSHSANCGVYGYRRIHLDLCELGESVSKNRVLKIMNAHNIKASRGYKRFQYGAGRPAIVTPNLLQREFTVARPNQAWVTDITYIRTWQGWLFLAVVMDLYARNIVGW